MNVTKSLTKAILLSAEKSIDGYIKAEDFIYNPGLYLDGYPRNINKSILSQALKRLRERGLIDFVSNEKLALRLTEKGKDLISWNSLNISSKKWDGKWRIVCFDIPEERRIARDLLRSKLKELGFVQWQKSLWAVKKDCTVMLRKFIKDVGIGDWVMVIESQNTGKKQ